MKALVLADRLREAEAAIPGVPCPAMLPVAGKPVLEHCLEDLWEAGVRQAVLAVAQPSDAVVQAFGAGERLGLRLDWLPTPGEAWPSAVLEATFTDDDPVLVCRGDVMRGRFARALVERAAREGLRDLHAFDGDRPAGMAIVGDCRDSADELDWQRLRSGAPPRTALRVHRMQAGVALLETLDALHAAGLQALHDRFAGTLPAGRADLDPDTLTGPRARLASTVLVEGRARIGRNAIVRDHVSISGTVDIGQDCVIDVGAEVTDSVVMPGTYVGRGVRLRNALVCGSWLLRADLGSCKEVDDPQLLARVIDRAPRLVRWASRLLRPSACATSSAAS